MSLVLVWMLACQEPGPVAPPPVAAPTPEPPRPSLVIVTTDTTRRDRIGAYGYTEGTTPNIDSLAAEGIRFDRAYTTAPLTIPAHSSILSGLYPSGHGVHSNGDAILPDQVDTLAEILKRNGYRTAASVSAFVTTRAWNFDQGFDTYADDLGGSSKANRWRQERPANEVVDDALAWLETVRAEPGAFFLWVHLYDPHRPYKPPPEWEAKFPERPYDGEVAFMDEQIGRLRSAVGALGQPTAWMILADHGEGLDEHGEPDHGMFLFQPTAAIPFMVKPVEAPAVHTSDALASGVDVLPTALGLVGIPIPAGLDGVDLLAAPDPARGVVLEAYSVQERFGYHPELAVVSGDLKLMATPNPRLFDLKADPGETVNLASKRAPDIDRLRPFLDRSKAADAGTGTVSPEVLQQLMALGYVSGGSIDTQNFTDVDAKDRLQEIARVEELRMLSRNPRKIAEAEAKAKKLVKDNPKLLEVRTLHAEMLRRQGRFDEADRVYRDAIAENPTAVQLRMNHASCLQEAGRNEEAVQVVESVLAQVPEDGQARVTLMRLLAMEGQAEQALAKGRAWLAEAPIDGLKAEVGILLAGMGRTDEATALLDETRASGAPPVNVLATLGRMREAAGDLEGARTFLEEEADRFPANRAARWTLGGILMKQEAWDDAADEYRLLAQEAPDPNARRAWAQAVFNAGDYALARDVLAPLVPEASDDPEIVLLQVNILDKLGDKAGAEALYERGKLIKAEQVESLRPPI